MATPVRKKPKRKCHFVYVVRCKDGTFYTGHTTNVGLRVIAHNNGRGARYTKTRRPVQLIYQERCQSLKAAYKRELAIKRMDRARKERLTKFPHQHHLRHPRPRQRQ